MKTRLTKLRSRMHEKSLDAVLLSSLPNIIYLTDFNHFSSYEREGFLLITHNNAYVITDKRYTHAVQTHLKDFTLMEIFYGHGFADLVKEIVHKEKIQTLGIEEHNLTYLEYKRIAPVVPQIKHFDLSDQRIIKSQEEIDTIQKACEIGDKAFDWIKSQFEEGITEKEIALLLEQYIKKHGGTNSFEPIVAFGANAAFVHHKTGNQKLKQHTEILLDFGVNYDNYCSDMTRTIFYGNATNEQKKAYQIVLDAQKAVSEFIANKLANNEKIFGKAVDNMAREYIMQHGFPSFPHGLGHGIGLEVHEAPSLRPPSQSMLQSGMVFSIEPGIYIPHKFGIRIEDLFVIQDNKLMQLTKSKRELIEV